MNRWAKHLLLSAALLLVALSSVSAWPSLRSADEDTLAMPPAVQSVTLSAITESVGTQEQTSAEQEPEAVTSAATSLPSTAPASTEQQEQPKTLSPEEAEALRLLAEDPDTLRLLLKESLGDRAYERIEPYIDIMISEYNDACNRHDALAAEYNALAVDHTEMLNDALDRDVDFIIVPEAIYDISTNQWGAGATLGISWKNLMFTAGAEKLLGMDTAWDEGYRVRLGVGISL